MINLTPAAVKAVQRFIRGSETPVAGLRLMISGGGCSGLQYGMKLENEKAEDDWEFEYDWLRDDLRERAGRAFPSLIPHDGWRGREDRILMRNAYADFGVSVYGGLVAVARHSG